jgi:hypothetical protein
MKRSGWMVATTSTAVVLALAVPAGSALAAPGDGARTAQRLGVQLVPKHQAGKKAGAFSNAGKGTNPFIGLLPDPSKADYAYWKSAMKQQSAKRAAKRAASLRALAPEPLLVDEEEPEDFLGSNDSLATAQLIPAFGSASDRRPAARILGTIAPSLAPDDIAAKREDNGSIPLAGETDLSGSGSTTTTDATIGDGPHGKAGDGKGDFDFYAVRGAAAGQRLVVDIDTPDDSDLDSLVFLYDAAGNAIAVNDDERYPEEIDSRLIFTLPAAGDYYVSVQSYLNFQDDPFDSGSGDGAWTEGDYTVTFGLDSVDVDTYAVNLRAGDVVGGSVAGSGSVLSVNDTAGREVQGSTLDASVLYPPNTPLPGGGNAVVDHVAARTGLHYVTVIGAEGRYDVTLEVYRPGPQAAAAVPTLFLDFDGQRVNTAPFDGPGVRTLSPLSAFLGRWGIPASQYNTLVDRIVDTVKENVKRDYAAQGTRVHVLNSRDHADPFGRPNVSRLIVGGTVNQAGISTIGIAQSIDPGNLETEETALILLDSVSDPPDPDLPSDYSFNAYLEPTSDKLKFVGTALGNLISHEAGHLVGSWHVDQFNRRLNLMDASGNFALLYGVGPDGIGGTADDPDVDFGNDVFNPAEFFTGLENTAARTLWGLHP